MSKAHLVVGNWKMYISSPEEAKNFATLFKRKLRTLSHVDVALAPSFTLLPLVASALKGTSVGISAQSISVFDTGAHTGEVAASMVKSYGATYSIIGHSERRAQGESNDAVRAQLMHAAAAGITPILCIGETERDATGAYLSVIVEQLSSALKDLYVPKPGAKVARAPKLVIAYEPVWAIGKSANDAMKGADLREMSIFIKKTLTDHFERSVAMRIPILYGGSVEASNAAALIEEGDINGFLVGRASTQVDSFVEILKAVQN